MPTTSARAEAGRLPLDDSTRYLAAAAHLDRHFADEAIREFLVEPTRQIPMTPGLDAPVVLTEAIAARSRRMYRDGLLALLTIVFLATSLGSPLLATWLSWAGMLSVRPIWKHARWGAPGTAVFVFLKLAAIFLLVAISWTFMVAVLVFEASLQPSSSFTGLVNPTSIISAVVMLVILVIDRIVVWQTVVLYFGRRARVPGPVARPPANRPSFTYSPPKFRKMLDWHRQGHQPESADARVPLVVYRGRNPFVGAGPNVAPWSLALPLEPGGKAKTDEPLTTSCFYQAVGKAVAELQENTTLSPDQRLRELKTEGIVFAPAEGLIGHVNDPAVAPYLPNILRRPVHYLPTDEATRVFHHSREWSRYYLSFQVETWDRELVLSAFLHAAVEKSTLYLEWTPCVLPPIREEYRAVDKMTNNLLRPIWQGVLRWVRLPVTGLGRFWHTVKLILPLPHDHYTLNADRYGSALTLRELGAADSPRDYFQVVDVDRYGKLLESRLVPAISKVLSDAGYSPASFEQRMASVTNNVTINGTNTAPMVLAGSIGGDVTTGGAPSPGS